MNEHRMRFVLLTAVMIIISTAASIPSIQVNAQTLEDVLGTRGRTTVAGVKSQLRVNEISEETSDLLSQYKKVMKIVDGLRVYNRQQRKMIENQGKEMVALTQSIEDAEVVERQITPLIERMIDTLEKFVELDIPFLLSERQERIAFLKETLSRPDVTAAEKFNQVMQAYQIENTYGSTIETYPDIVPIGDRERQVDMLKFGRVALVYQTSNGDVTGVWDNTARKFVVLGDEYRTEVRNALSMARKTATPNLVRLPVVAPGE